MNDNDKPPVTLIEARKISLKLDNPRYGHLAVSSEKPLTDKDLHNAIWDEDATVPLFKSIRKDGVDEPLRVKETGDGRYVVFEGNRRTVCLRKLISDCDSGAPPKGKSLSDYELVQAHVYPEDFSEAKIQILMGRLQTGKKAWKAADFAKYVYDLRHDFVMGIEDIAIDLQLKVKNVKDYMVNWELFREYCEKQNHNDPSKYSMIEGAGSKVRQHHFETNQANKEKYFDLISPTSGKQKIFGAAYELRTYNKVVENKAARDTLYNDSETSMDDALEIVKASDALAAMPFLKNINPVATKLMDLDDSKIEQIAADQELKVAIKKLKRACDQVIERIERVNN